MAPGTSGNVVAKGTWASNRKLTVTADDDVTLTNNINSEDKKVLDVTFPGIELAGSNTAAVTDTKVVSVAGIDNALFGTWSGTFYYDVEMVDNVELITFTIDIWEMQAEKGMTWSELAESDDYKWAVFGPYVYIQDGIAMFRDTNMIKDYTIVDDGMAVNANDVIVAGHTYDAVEDYSAEE